MTNKPMTDKPQLTAHQTLNLETGRINIKELLPHFARGVLIQVQANLDLVNVGIQFKQDNSKQVEKWLKTSEVAPPNKQNIIRWQNENTEFWALVISPWVLAQEIPLSESDKPPAD